MKQFIQRFHGRIQLERRGFLNQVYSGSLGLMVGAMVNPWSLSDREIEEERKEILKKAEGGRNG